MKLRKITSFFMLLSLLGTSRGSIASTDIDSNSGDPDDTSTNILSTTAPECKDIALSYLLGGQDDYDSTRVGSRLWNLDKLENASPSSDVEKKCLAKIWVQANRDARDYWIHIGTKYHCFVEEASPSNSGNSDESALITSPNSTCSAKKLSAVALNLRYLKASFDLRHVASSNGTIDQVCDSDSEGVVSTQNVGNIRSVMKVVNNVISNSADTQQPSKVAPHKPEAMPQAQTIASGMSLCEVMGSCEAAGDVAELASCRLSALNDKGVLDESLLKPIYQSDEYKKNHHPNFAVNVAEGYLGCGVDFYKNFFESIWGDLKGLVTSIGSALKFVGKYESDQTKFLMKVAKALLHHSRGMLARQQQTEGVPMKAQLEKWISDAFTVLKTKLVNEHEQFKCFNAKAATEKVCGIAGYLGPDILMLIPGFQEGLIVKLEGIPKFGEALKKVRLAKKTFSDNFTTPLKQEAMSVGGGAIKLTGDALSAFMKFANKATWFRDASSGLKAALVGGQVYVMTAAGEISKVYQPSVYKRLQAAIEKHLGPSAVIGAADNAASQAKKTLVQKTAQYTTKYPIKIAQKSWSKISLDQRQTSALAKNAKKAEKAAAKLPAHYTLDSTLTDVSYEDAPNKAAWIAARKAEAQESSELLGFTPIGSNYVTKDGLQFQRVQHADGTWWYATDSRLATVGKTAASTTTQFPVYITVDPANIGKSLKEVSELAAKQGSQAIEIAGSSATLTRGDRLAVYFNDPESAKKFIGKISAKTSLGVVREQTVGKSIAKITTQSVSEAAYSKCTGLHDNQCYCHVFLDAGINPESGLPAELSPFRCSSDSDAQSAMEISIHNYKEAHPNGVPDALSKKLLQHEDM
jgi:hypothetical protein